MKFISSVLLALTICAYTHARQQIPLGRSSSLTSSLNSLPPAVLADLHTRIDSLPLDHFTRLARHVASLTEPRLVKLAETAEPISVTEGEKALLKLAKIGRFIDVTEDEARDYVVVNAPAAKYPTKFRHSKAELEKTVYKDLSMDDVRDFLREFTSFYTRYYRSPTGKQSQQFLLKTLTDINEKYGQDINVTIKEYEHSWGQASIIVRFEPQTQVREPPIVLLSAHQDSTNSLPFLRAPGADDDGAATAMLAVGVFKALLKSSYAPTSAALEIHFYSAEEGGLLGSGEVSRAYIDAGKRMLSVFHMDVIAFVKKGTEPRIGVISDNVDEGLTDFMRRVVREFADISYVDTQCGYGCSDHASWAKLGAPAACLSEGKFEDTNTNMHSAQDTMDQPEFSFDHIEQLAKVATAYALELAEMQRV